MGERRYPRLQITLEAFNEAANSKPSPSSFMTKQSNKCFFKQSPTIASDKERQEGSLSIKIDHKYCEELFKIYHLLELVHEGLKKHVELNKSEDCTISDQYENKACDQAMIALWYTSFWLYYFYEKLHPSKVQANQYLASLKFLNLSIEGNNNKIFSELCVEYLHERTSITWTKHAEEMPVSYFSARQFRLKFFPNMNTIRLWVVRFGRAVACAVMLAVALRFTNQVVAGMNVIKQFFNVLAPTFAYVSFLVYAPRLIINLALLVKHTFFHKHGALTRQEGFKIQWQRREFQILNDFIWFVDGLLVFMLAKFVAVSVATPVGFLLVGLLYFFDVWNSYKAYKNALSYRKKVLEQFSGLEYSSSVTEYMDELIQDKLRSFRFTLAYAMGMLPLIAVGVAALALGLSVLLNPVAIGALLAGAVFVLSLCTCQMFNLIKKKGAVAVEGNKVKLDAEHKIPDSALLGSSKEGETVRDQEFSVISPPSSKQFASNFFQNSRADAGIKNTGCSQAIASA